MQRFPVAGKSLSIQLTYADARLLTKQLGVTLCDPATSRRLAGPERYELLPEIIAVLCRDEIARNWPDLGKDLEVILGFLDEQLGPEEAFQKAHAALMEEWADFLDRKGHHQHAKSVRHSTRLVASDLAATEEAFAMGLEQAEKILAKRASGTQTPGPTSSDGSENLELTATT